MNEVIIATNSTVEGEATAMYLSRQLAPLMGKEGSEDIVLILALLLLV